MAGYLSTMDKPVPMSTLFPALEQNELVPGGKEPKQALTGQHLAELIRNGKESVITTVIDKFDAALKAGASKEEISEALGVAVAMNAGAALIYSTRVLDAVEAKSAAAAK